MGMFVATKMEGVGFLGGVFFEPSGDAGFASRRKNAQKSFLLQSYQQLVGVV